MIKQNRGIFDTFPLSLITTQTISKLGEAIGTELDVQRFRPNFLVEANDETLSPKTAGSVVFYALVVCACASTNATADVL